MEYLMFYVGLITIAIIVGLFWRQDRREAWEEGFMAGQKYGTITIEYEEIKEDEED